MNEERQINIRELVFAIIQKWRRIAVCTLISMVLTGIINIPSAIKYVNQLGVILVIKTLLKQVLFIGIITLVGIVIIYFFMYITSDKIKSVVDYSLNCDIKLLGISTRKNYTYNNFFDRYIKKCRGINVHYSEQDEYIKRIINVIKAELAVRDNEAEFKIALVSECANEVISDLKKLLDEKIEDEKIVFTLAGDVLKSAESVDTVMRAKYIIMVGCEEMTTYSNLNNSLELMKTWQKDIIGMILVNVDAM